MNESELNFENIHEIKQHHLVSAALMPTTTHNVILDGSSLAK
jgi:hypothetical protein